MAFVFILLVALSANAWAAGVDSMGWIIVAVVAYLATPMVLEGYSKFATRSRKE